MVLIVQILILVGIHHGKMPQYVTRHVAAVWRLNLTHQTEHTFHMSRRTRAANKECSDQCQGRKKQHALCPTTPHEQRWYREGTTVVALQSNAPTPIWESGEYVSKCLYEIRYQEVVRGHHQDQNIVLQH